VTAKRRSYTLEVLRLQRAASAVSCLRVSCVLVNAAPCTSKVVPSCLCSLVVCAGTRDLVVSVPGQLASYEPTDPGSTSVVAIVTGLRRNRLEAL